MVYLQLFISFFKIGIFAVGGGYAIITLIQHEIVTYGWMTPAELTDIIAISQMTPGHSALTQPLMWVMLLPEYLGSRHRNFCHYPALLHHHDHPYQVFLRDAKKQIPAICTQRVASHGGGNDSCGGYLVNEQRKLHRL